MRERGPCRLTTARAAKTIPCALLIMETVARPPVTGWQRWWRFNGVGIAGIAVQLGTLSLLVDGLSIGFRLATPIAVATAVAHNFAWHSRWTWGDRAADVSPLSLFVRFAAGNGLVSLAGNTALMELLVGAAGVPVMPANAVAIAACGLLNYWWADRLVFKPAPGGLRGRARTR